jgi:hypothetical protein
MTGAVLGNSLVVLAAIGFWGYCLVDFTRTDELEMRLFSKPVWVVLLVFTSILGSLLWLFVGRPPQRPSRR